MDLPEAASGERLQLRNNPLSPQICEICEDEGKNIPSIVEGMLLVIDNLLQIVHPKKACYAAFSTLSAASLPVYSAPPVLGPAK